MNLLEFLLNTLVKTPDRFIVIMYEFCGLKINPEDLNEITDYIGEVISSTILYKSLEKKLLVEYPEYILNTNQLSVTYRNVVTLNGYPFDVAKSALQKYIRRGMVKQAQNMACELDVFRWVPDGKANFTNFVNRVRVIALEDIGIGAPYELVTVAKLLENWVNQDNGILSENLTLLMRVLCQVPHSRYYSHVKMYYLKNPPIDVQKPNARHPLGKDENIREIVDQLVWCIENKDESAVYWILKILEKPKLITKRQRSADPGFLVFEILEKTVKNKPEILVTSIEMCKAWYKILKVKERFLCCMHPVYVWIFSDRINENPIPSDVADQGLLRPYRDVLLNRKFDLSDYVYDMHTKLGKKYGRDSADFGVEGALVMYDININQEFADFYNQVKISDGIIKREKDVFTLKARAQLNCTKTRPDTYFAVNQLGQNVVVKGPYPNKDQALMTLRVQSVIGLFEGVNTVDTSLKFLIPNMFTSTPLGFRASVTPDTGYYFIVMRDLFNEDTYSTEIKSSKLWPETRVVNYQKLFDENSEYGFGTPSTMNDTALFSMLLQLGIRYVFQIGDFAYRNFIRIGDQVWNLDTEGVGVSGTVRFSKQEKDILVKFLKNNRKKYISALHAWNTNDVAWNLAGVTFGLETVKIGKEILSGIISDPNTMFE